jgi:hypothetical protein
MEGDIPGTSFDGGRAAVPVAVAAVAVAAVAVAVVVTNGSGCSDFPNPNAYHVE